MVVTVHLDPLRGGTVHMNLHGGPDWTWEPASAAHCYACEHEGTVAEFHADGSPPGTRIPPF